MLGSTEAMAVPPASYITPPETLLPACNAPPETALPAAGADAPVDKKDGDDGMVVKDIAHETEGANENIKMPNTVVKDRARLAFERKNEAFDIIHFNPQIVSRHRKYKTLQGIFKVKAISAGFMGQFCQFCHQFPRALVFRRPLF